MSSLLKKVCGRIYSRHSINNQYDAIYLFGLRFRVKKRANARRVGSSYAYASDLPIENTKIVLRSERYNYSGNPKYIAEEILRQGLPWELVWIVDKNILRYRNDFPPAIRLDMIGTPESIEDLSTAHIWIDDTWHTYLQDLNLFKKKGQVYIQTWRGSFGIKKFGLGRNSYNPDNWERTWADVRQMDYFISHSAWESNFYRRTFRAKKILELGHPRNDIFFRKNQKETRCRIFEKLGIPPEKKLVLYAPTRNNNRGRSAFSMDYVAILQALSKKFGGEWVMAARMTPFANHERILPEDLGIINVSSYTDIQEILVAADACISDYSSCIFDFLHTGRPAFIYAADHVSFERGRGLYYPLTQTPFPFAENNVQMIKNILDFDSNAYSAKVANFLKSKGSIDDGHAAEKTVMFIQEIIHQERI